MYTLTKFCSGLPQLFTTIDVDFAHGEMVMCTFFNSCLNHCHPCILLKLKPCNTLIIKTYFESCAESRLE